MRPADPAIDGNGAPHGASSGADRACFLENLQDLNYLHLLYFWTVARDGSMAGACERLHVGQPTISMQIRKLERTLGHSLFDRSGRSLRLTEVGRTVYDYADEMFSLGRELLGALRGLPGRRTGRLHIGVPNFLPKLIIKRLLEPVLRQSPRPQLVCREAEIDDLIAGLARHRFDVILSDRQVASPATQRTFNHPLGECDIAICGRPELAAAHREGFPDSLDGAPFFLPTNATEMRRTLDRWFDSRGQAPKVVGEFDDSALMKEFGGGGGGLFPIPSAVLPEVQRQYGVELVERLTNLHVRYYAVTTERKLTHPATIVIAQAAKDCLNRAQVARGGAASTH